MMWQKPIFDRTQADVEFAIQKISEWIVADITGNPVVVYDLKGCLNLSDINRIEGNISYLASQLTKLSYPSQVFTKEWTRDGLPTVADIERITNNVASLINAYYKPTDAPSIPIRINGYDDVNSIEKNLYLINQLLEAMIGSFRKSGTFKSGSTRMLPVRR